MDNPSIVSKRVGAIIVVCYLTLSLIISTFVTINLWYISKSVKDFKVEIHKHQYTTVADDKTRDMRVTGYTPTGKKTALGEDVIVGYTAAISPNCADSFLGKRVYIRGLGVRYINDLTAAWVAEKYDVCTLDIAVPNKQETLRIGNEIKQVVRIP